MNLALPTTIHEAIVATCTQADKANQQAIVLDDEQITYAQLLQRAQTLATHLRTTHHVKVGDIIAQCVERSIDMAVGMVAILLAGAIYCPLNPANPLDRLLTLMQETHARIVLTHAQTAAKFSITTAGLIMVDIQSEFDTSIDHCCLPPVHVDPHSVAYLIHTSGSSGKPKSVQLTHDNFLNSLYGYRTTGMYCLQQDRVLQMSASSFDIHVMECLAPLVNGSTCVMLKPDGHLDLAYIVSTIHRHRVTVAFFVPSFLYTLYEYLEQTKQYQLLTSMRQIVFGGEASHPVRLAPLFAALSQPSLNIQLVNGYGPAETTVFATHHRVTQYDLDRNLIPIGVPLPNYTCHILDEHLSAVPVNTIGELYIGGRGVFAGYFGDNETIRALNDKVFVRLPFEETVCYRTGDLCRLAESGEIIFCCRADDQVKLRGQRLEIGEIEACVMRVEGVSNCVVVKRTDARTQQDFLVAFVQSRIPNGTDDLRKSILLQCRTRLPDYMVPSVVSVMDKLPLNLNGKVDRKQLLDIVDVPDASVKHISPRTELETYVHSCWCHLLRRSEISVLADFFSIGGDSLLCMKLLCTYRTKFGLARLTIRDLFNANTIEEQAKLIQISQDASLIRSTALYRTGRITAVASHAQQRLYIDEELRFRNSDLNAISVYSIPIATRIEGGHFDAHRLRKTLHQLIERHEILRTTYALDEQSGTIQQNVQSVENYRQVEWRINESEIIGSINRRFDLNNGPLVRCDVVMSESSQVESFIVSIHHIAFDGASIPIFCSELAALYNGKTLAPLPMQYIDYTLQVDQMVSEDDAAHRQFWTDTLANCIDNELLLPFDRPRSSVVNRSGAAGIVHQDIPPLLLAQMKAHRESNQITLFMQLLAAYQMFLARLTGQSDICVGSVNANRPRDELAGLIGFFVNTVPYHIRIAPHDDTLQTIYIRVKQMCLDVMKHASFPFDEIVRLHRSMDNRSKAAPFFQTVLRYENVHEFPTYIDFTDDTNSSIHTSEYTLNASSTMFDLQLLLRHKPQDDQQEHLRMSFIYAQDLFDERTVQEMMSRFSLFIQNLFLNDASCSTVAQYTLVLPHERELIDQLMQTKMDFGCANTIHEAIVAICTQADKANQQAIVLDDEQITYAQLLQRAQTLATHLRTTHHVKVGDIIAQCVERSIDMAVGMVAILLAGAIYCPLNPANPLDRLLTLMQETHARIVLTHAQTAAKFSITTAGLIMVDIQSEFDTSIDHCCLSPVHVDPHSVAYLIHTSGSSGKPKSVQLTHDNFLNSLYGYRTTGMYCLQQDRVLQMSASSFDIHVMECLAPLVNGSTCVMLKPDGHLDLAYIVSTIHRHRVTVAFFVPSFLYTLYEYLEQTKQYQLLTSMRQIVFGGEASHPVRLAPLFAALSQPSLNIQLVNGYGPAETTVFATHHRVTQYDLDRNLIPIGVPLPNYTCHILDEHLSAVPVNTIGELYIGGRGVFAGYFGDNETIRALNDKVFVRLPFEETVCYRTGDLCRLAESGEIIFCCRADDQVKLRGQRLEIGEIEACVMRVEGVSNCVVVKRTDARTQQDFLVAFVQSRIPNGTDDLRKSILLQCRTRLPDYMVPSVVSVMDKLPLNLNGKVDRKQLSDIELVQQDAARTEDTLLSSELERLVRAQWCNLLGLSNLPLNADFFAFGGNSLMLMRLLGAYRAGKLINENQPITIASLFEQTTITDHAKLLQLPPSNASSTQRNMEERWQQHGVNEAMASSAQQRIWVDEQLRSSQSNSLAMYNIPLPVCIGKGSTPVSIIQLRRALWFVIRKHKILRTRLNALENDESESSLHQSVKSMSPRLNDDAEFYSFSEQSCCSDEEVLRALSVEVSSPFFSLSEGRVVRCHILRRRSELGDEYLAEKDIVVFNIHHIAFDGSSRAPFFADLQQAYNNGTEKTVPTNNLFQYIDYSIYEQHWLADESQVNAAKTFWMNSLSDFVFHPLALPYDHPQRVSQVRTGQGDTCHFELSNNLVMAMRQFCDKQHISMFMLGLAVWQLFLSLLSGQRDVCVGSVNDGRRGRPELNSLVGMFVNTLPYRIRIDRAETFVELVVRVRDLCLGALEYARLPYQNIVELHRSKSDGDASLIHSVFAYETRRRHHGEHALPELQLGDTPLHSVQLPCVVAKFDLVLYMLHDNDDKQHHTLDFSLDYTTDLFERSTVRTLVDRFQMLLSDIFLTSDKQQQPLSCLSFVLPHELELIARLNGPSLSHVPEWSNEETIGSIFLNVASKYTEKLALQLDNESLTYGELAKRACRLAHQLKVKKQYVVCQCMERSLEMVIGLLAVEIAGAIYCPLNPNDPPERLRFLVNDTHAQLVLVHNATKHLFADGLLPEYVSIVNINDKQDSSQSKNAVKTCTNDFAYIIYTSGSTGKPKGVAITHGNFVNHWRGLTQPLRNDSLALLSVDDTVLATAVATFDISLTEMLCPLLTGARLIMLRADGHLDASYITEKIQGCGVTLMFAVPSLLQAIFDECASQHQWARLETIRSLWCGGEALPVSLAATARANVVRLREMVNLYGPTECTIAATYHRVCQEDLDRNVIPIGVPLLNYTCHILDEYLLPIPVNTVGELYIGGRGVFTGYLGDNHTIRSLNQKALVSLPGHDQQILFYRTGDLCRLSESGHILYCGRADHQVKLRGQRLEIGEIEACVMRVKGVANCVIMKRTDARTQQDFLVAFVQSHSPNDTDDLRKTITRQCRTQLPAFMVPSVVNVMDKLPRNPNGKVDRKQLSDIELMQKHEVTSANASPESKLTHIVHRLWCQILGIASVPMNVSFFAVGGNSILLMRLFGLYQKAGLVGGPKPITVASLFEKTMAAEHARLLYLSEKADELSSCTTTSDQWTALRVHKGPASSAQQRIWLDEQIRFSKPDWPAMYNIPLPVIVGKNGKRVSVARLRQALLAVIRKHKVLRTRLQYQVSANGGTIEQFVNAMSQNLDYDIFSEQLCDTDEQVRQGLIAEITQQLFSLNDGHVVRCHIIRRRSTLHDEHFSEGDIIVFNIHHAVFDGTSRMLFFRDIELAYEKEHAFSATINDDEFQYIDYSVYESNLLLDTSSTSVMNKAREYWKTTLKDCTDKQLFPEITSTNKVGTNTIGGNLSFALPESLSTTLRSLAVSENMTLFQLFLACYQLFLHKLTHQTDICVGSVSENRYRSELEQLIGMFVNILPYRTKIDMNQETSVHDFLVGVRLLCLDVLQHGHLPFQDIVQLHRNPEHQYQSPFFQTTLVFETCSSDNLSFSLDGVLCNSVELPMNVAKYDLSLVVRHNTTDKRITCTWEYSTQLFDEATLDVFSNRFISLLNQMTKKQSSIRSLHILLPHEQKLLHSLNDTHVDFNDDYNSCIAAQFDMHARQFPNRTCVILDNTRVTYAQVYNYSNQLADYLVDKCGVQPGDIVMQCVQRSIDMVIGILAILKARATYCPLNPADPADRHALLVEDTRARFILCHEGTHTAFTWTTTYKQQLTLVNISTFASQTSTTKSYSPSRPPNKPNDRAYIIFTSGSTHKPKAVQIRHCNFLAFIRACQHLKLFRSTKDTILQFTQCSYDVHMFELVGCIVTGNTLVMLKPLGNMDMDYVSRTIAEQRVTWAILTPTVTASIVQFLQTNPEHADRLQSLRICVSGGEAMVPNIVGKLRQYLSSDARIYNMYGPAECSMCTTYHLVTPADLHASSVPIGTPLPNYTCHILDEYLSPVPVNSLGELYIGGPGVFAGYLGDNEKIRSLNEKALVCLPGHDQNTLFYRTGDLCRLSDDGKLIYAGRMDHQVKIRGQRLELGEVEASLIDRDVTGCAVVKFVDEMTNEEYLAAYIQAAEHIPSTEYNTIQARVLAHCTQKLPAYMVPTAWLVVNKLPLNSNDKIDRKQLPKISRASTLRATLPVSSPTKQQVSIAGSHPMTLIEEEIRDIFCQALNAKLDKSQLDIPFGQLGGTSLSAMTVVTIVRRRLYKAMEIGLLFKHSTVRQLASELAHLQSLQSDRAIKRQCSSDTVIELEPLIEVTSETDDDKQAKENNRAPPSPSLLLEAIGIFLLICHYLYPAWASLKIIRFVPLQDLVIRNKSSATYFEYWIASAIEFSLLFAIMPSIQLGIYLICKWALLGRLEPGEDRLYSWRYYCHWFVHRLWLLNNPQLTAIIGTSVYNLYLRMCGAHIGRNVHINTTLIDTPDLLSVDDHTYIASGVTLASLSYGRRMYKLDRVHIDSNCSVQTRCVLQHGVRIRNNALVKSMSFVSGEVSANSTVDGTDVQCNNRPPRDSFSEKLSFNWLQIGYQWVCLLFVYALQIIVPLTTYATYIYLFPNISRIYFFVCLPAFWIVWSFANVILCILILVIIIGRVRSDTTYPVNSWYFIHKLWFRQLIVNTFGDSFFLFGGYHRLYPVFLRWFGARLGNDVRIGDFGMLLAGLPSLITAGNGVTTNGRCLIAPIDVVDGECKMQRVDIGEGASLGNMITVHGGAFIPDRCMIGSMTRVEADHNFGDNSIILGVPAHELPFSSSSSTTMPVEQKQWKPSCCTHVWRAVVESFLEIVLATVLSKLVVTICGLCLVFFVFLDKSSNFVTLTNIFLLLPSLYLLFIVLFSIAFCLCYRACNRDLWQQGTYSYQKVISWRRHLSWYLITDYGKCVTTFLGGTQWLVFVLRGNGARIGRNVILNDFLNVIDPQLITIDDYVRISGTASVQCHTFEHRLFKLAPTHIGEGSVLDHASMVFSGCELEGNNRILPCTLILKGDHLPKGTTWSGNPARQRI